jgi:hypothetical protein
MTAYFSLPIEGIENTYSVSTYWITFLVILILSFVLLVIFGQMSGTQEGRTIFRPLSRAFLEFLHIIPRDRKRRQIKEKQ